MNDLHDIEVSLKSQTPILLIESREERRLLEMFTRLGLRLSLPMFRWSITEGLARTEVDFGNMTGTSEPTEVLRHIKAVSKPGIYLLLDFHPYLEDPLHVRLLKEIAQEYQDIQRTLVLISHNINTPDELSHLTAHFELRLPDQGALRQLIREEAGHWQKANPGRKLQADREALGKLASNLSGVTLQQARRLIRTAISDDGAISHSDIPEVMKAKNALMNRDNIISFEYDTEDFANVAGLSKLKQWIAQRKSAFEKNHDGLDAPKGILLLGVQGSGKSLAARAVAGFFGIPLLRLDFGMLYNKYIGETEKNLRQALHTAEVMSPCILWIDEIEKGLAQGSNDDGVSRRVLGTLLTWMAEHKGTVFLVATANDIEQLPPELMRKGRIDEIFFIDLPDAASREEIFSIHLRKRNLAPSGFDLPRLAQLSDGFSGAEIEQAVVGALYASNSQNHAVTSDTIAAEIERTQPLSVIMAEKIADLRDWASQRTVPAH
ncbi:MAG: AAA family ATPase [Chromatiales bacterium]|jgi:SpoVK/Ycf46/Vps4 family AAA+-type ATPase